MTQSESARVTTNALSQTERDTISRFVDKRQRFPGPSNSEVRGAVEVLLQQCCSQTNVVALLGKASSVSTSDRKGAFGERLAYDIGDSRRIEILFNTNGTVTEVVGIGVGFGKLKVQSEASGKRTVIADPEK